MAIPSPRGCVIAAREPRGAASFLPVPAVLKGVGVTVITEHGPVCPAFWGQILAFLLRIARANKTAREAG